MQLTDGAAGGDGAGRSVGGDGGGDAFTTANAAVCVGGGRRRQVTDGADGGAGADGHCRW